MEKIKKYKWSMLPFISYQKEKKRLEMWRENGWEVIDCSLLGYTLLSAPPQKKHYQFVMTRSPDVLERWTGGTLLCSSLVFHILEIEDPTSPFPDQKTIQVAREYKSRSLAWALAFGFSFLLFLFTTIFLFILSSSPLFSSQTLYFIFAVTGTISLFSSFRWARSRLIYAKALAVLADQKTNYSSF